jgi:nucleoside-diphosphate-sugar epimerase
MIIGNGDIGTQLKTTLSIPNDFLFFASGVSDSKCTDRLEFNREIELLKKHIYTDKHFVYFSSYSVFHKNSDYAAHKWRVEKLIESTRSNYTIARICNIGWGKNPNTMLNYFKAAIEDNRHYAVYDEARVITFQKDFNKAVSEIIITRPREYNIKGVRLSVNEIVKMIKNGEL